MRGGASGRATATRISLVVERRGEEAEVEVGGGDRALAAGTAGDHAAVEGDQGGGQLGGGVGVGDAAADGPARADLRVADLGQRRGDQGCGLGHERVALGLALAHGGADDELVALAGDLVQAGNAAQVDQQLGLGQAQVE